MKLPDLKCVWSHDIAHGGIAYFVKKPSRDIAIVSRAPTLWREYQLYIELITHQIIPGEKLSSQSRHHILEVEL